MHAKYNTGGPNVGPKTIVRVPIKIIIRIFLQLIFSLKAILL
jgi:hypothetical protein